MRIQGDGIELHVASYGPIGGDAVILIGDADAPMIRWSQNLIEVFVSAGFRVVTFDHRDCGLSAEVPQSYDLGAMAADVVQVMQSCGLTQAALLGFGMGGTIALHVALEYPSVVSAMVLVGASPGRTDEALPDPAAELVDAMVARSWAPIPEARSERIIWLVERAELFAGSRYVFDDVVEMSLAIDEVDTCWRPSSGHGEAVVATESIRGRLGDITQPVMVVHGDSDPVFPLGHGEALHAGLRASELVVVEGLGHEMPSGLVDEYGATWVSFLAGH